MMIITNQNWLSIAQWYSLEIGIDGKAVKNSIFPHNFVHVCYYSGLRKRRVAHKSSGLWTPKAGSNPELSNLVCVA